MGNGSARLALRRLILPVSLLFFAAAASSANEFVRPAGLEPEIAFWRSVFAITDTDHALVHDKRHLSVVYETVRLPADASARERRAISQRVREKYRVILAHLASGQRDGLTAEQRRVLALWPDGVSSAELRRAQDRIRLQQGLSDRFRAGLIRSGRWQDHIRASLDREGVPAGLGALPHVESSFNPEARSHVGASGLWQFTRSTGKRFMRIDHVIDERRDPYISSDAAARLLAYNYSILQSWPLAITAYNHGVAGMRRAVKTVGTEDIETIIRQYKGRSFGFASRNFYVAFLAALEVQRDAERYFGPLTLDRPRPDAVIAMTDYVPAETIADSLEVSSATLRALNPALLQPVWDGTKYVPKGYALRVPNLSSEQTPRQLIAAIPASRRYAEQTPDLYHKVQRGDSLSVIAARYDTSVSELVALNDLRSRNKIRAGQTLRLPYRGPVSAAPIESGAATYTVRNGDTVGTIAVRAGLSERELLELNDIVDRNRIFPGQELRLQGDAGELLASETRAEAPAEVVAEEASEDETPLETTAEALSAAEDEDPDAAGEQPLLADPSDYLVAADGTIEIQAAETLGHYADWLDIPTQRLRDINGYAYGRPVVIGQRLKLDMRHVSGGTFTARRVAHHRALQEMFFTRYRVVDTMEHRLRKGESVWLLTQRDYKVPVWLLRQYNPDLDLARVRPGTTLVFPRIGPAVTDSPDRQTLADASVSG